MKNYNTPVAEMLVLLGSDGQIHTADILRASGEAEPSQISAKSSGGAYELDFRDLR